MYSDPIAFFLTWTCYGTWLPGDDRGWTKWKKGDRLPQPLLMHWSAKRLTYPPVLLRDHQRTIVNETIADHCGKRGWFLHAVNCRTNHCHCVLTVRDLDGELVRDQLKSWCTRLLNEDFSINSVEKLQVPKKWWTRKGSVRYLFDEESLEAAVRYTLEAQDVGESNFVPY